MYSSLPDHIALDIHHAMLQLNNMADRYDYSLLEDDQMYIFKRFIFLPSVNAIEDVLVLLGSLTYMEAMDVRKTITEVCYLVKEELDKLMLPIYYYRLDILTDDIAFLTRDDLEQ